MEELRRLIGLARPAWQDEEVMNIIREEAAAYFHGQKSLETVTGLIDNRVGLYMNERVTVHSVPPRGVFMRILHENPETACAKMSSFAHFVCIMLQFTAKP